jgi:para-aminobenzoate synthetase component 1
VIYEPPCIEIFKEKAQLWASSFSTVCIFNSNGYPDPYGSISLMISVGSQAKFSGKLSGDYQALQGFLDSHQSAFIPGYLTYEEEAFFFVPEHRLIFNEHHVRIEGQNADKIIQEIEATVLLEQSINFKGNLNPRMSQREYNEAFSALQEHILRGDIYEVNLCQEFYAENARINDYEAFRALNQISPTPFACYFRNGDEVVISASPERFLQKQGSQLISQPIKGTRARAKDLREDEVVKEDLRNDPKEISENVMIVDLVRNDLTRSARAGSVHVAELMGIYSFRQVHQMISTIRCTLRDDITVSEVLQNTFPPGSMTGAPKLRAMELIRQYEKGSRGLYSGCIGYFDEKRNFDFNVVIRSLFYNRGTGLLSYQVGGAVTSRANHEDEYQECLIKASAIRQLLSGEQT